MLFRRPRYVFSSLTNSTTFETASKIPGEVRTLGDRKSGGLLDEGNVNKKFLQNIWNVVRNLKLERRFSKLA